LTVTEDRFGNRSITNLKGHSISKGGSAYTDSVRNMFITKENSETVQKTAQREFISITWTTRHYRIIRTVR